MKRLDPRAIQPSDTDGDTLVTEGGVAVWGAGGAGDGGPKTAPFKLSGDLVAGVGATRLYADVEVTQ